MLITRINCKLFVIQMSEWDRFAAEEYELLVAEEGGSDAQDQM